MARFFETLEELKTEDPAADAIVAYLYTADPKLPSILEEVFALAALPHRSRSQERAMGELMEKVAYLAFSRLKGKSSIKSFQSAGPQYDLIVTGESSDWLTLCRFLYMEIASRDIIVEAKATKRRVSDKQFARLCAIIDHNLHTAGLGVFLTLEGASGFPTAGRRQRGLRDCRLRQVIYHARKGVPVVVFDKTDLQDLSGNGSLVRILIRKIRDVSELSGLPTNPVSCVIDLDLPDHLAALREG